MVAGGGRKEREEDGGGLGGGRHGREVFGGFRGLDRGKEIERTDRENGHENSRSACQGSTAYDKKKGSTAFLNILIFFVCCHG